MPFLSGFAGQLGILSRRRPAVVLAILLILGIASHRALPAEPLAYVAIGLVAGAGALMLRSRAASGGVLLSAAIFLLGVAGAQLQAFFYSPRHLGNFAGEDGRLATVEMRVEEAPRLITGSMDTRRAMPPRQVTRGRVMRVLTKDGWTAGEGITLVSVGQPHPRLAQGQVVRATGMLHRPGGPMNPGEMDWAAYYRSQRILTTLGVAHASNITIIEDGGITWLEWLRREARSALVAGFKQEKALDHALLRALVLGDSDPLLRDVQQDFVRTGTSHHLAISGMHVAVLGACVWGICRMLFVPPRMAAWIGLGFVLLYGAVTLPSPPVVRSVLLCGFFAAGLLSRRHVDGVQLLAATVFAMLVYQPLDLYNAGFELSFGTVLGLMLLSRRVKSAIFREKTGDEKLLDTVVAPPKVWRSIGGWLWSGTKEAISAGLVAWLVSAPLIWRHFDQINPYAIPASIVLSFPVLFGLVGGLLKIALTLLIPSAAPLWAWLAAQPMAWMRGMVDLLAKIPGSDYPLPAPPIWLMVVIYALIAAPFVVRIPRPTWSGLLRYGPVTAGVMLVMLPALLGFGAAAGRRTEVRLTVLSVGAGQCAVLELPSGKRVMFDAGSASTDGVAGRIILPFFRREGYPRLDYVLISHPDSDHAGAVMEVAQSCDVGAFVVSSKFAGDCGRDPAAMRVLDAMGGRMRTAGAGERIVLDEQTTLEVIWPGDGGALSGRNEHSLVVKVVCRGRSILLTGDIMAGAQRQLLADSARLKADVLVAPHHGSFEQTTAEFVSAIDPSIVVASNQRRLTGKQKLFDRSLEAGRALYRTHDVGAVTICIAGDGKMRVETFKPGRARRAAPQ